MRKGSREQGKEFRIAVKVYAGKPATGFESRARVFEVVSTCDSGDKFCANCQQDGGKRGATPK